MREPTRLADRLLTAWAAELDFDAFVFWPKAEPREQIERFAAEVAPAVRAAVARA
jgi:hypothetical protein